MSEENQIKFPLYFGVTKTVHIFCVFFYLASGIAAFFLRDTFPIGSYVVMAFCCVATAFSAINLHPRGAYLLLTEEGMTVRNLLRNRFIPWDAFVNFYPASVSYGTSVWYDLKDDYRDGHLGKVGRVVGAVGGTAKGFLPDKYGMDTMELVHIMNDLRVRYSGANT
jgi:hypothetical protein